MYACVGAMFATVAFANGVTGPLLATTPTLAWLVAAGVAIHAAKFSRSKRGVFHRVTFTGAAAIAVTSVFHGVLVVVPTLAAVNAMGYVLTTSRSNRIVVVTMNALALIVPSALVWFGVRPVEHLFDLHRLEISGGPVSWPRHALIVLSLVNVAILILAGRFAGRYRDAPTAAETRSALQAWHRKLVPDAAADGLREEDAT